MTLRRLLLQLSLLGAMFGIMACNMGLAHAQSSLPYLQLPSPGIDARHLAIVINIRDPLSWKIADYYQRQHAVPARNMIHIAFNPGKPKMHPGEFAVLKKIVDNKTPASVQAYLLTWAQPYRVGCMSISAAFALGFDNRYCAKGCKYTAANAYAESHSRRPFDDFGIRPTMLLAAEDFAEAKRLINRGVRSRGWFFNGPVKQPAAYLVETPDKVRSVRKTYFPDIIARMGHRLNIHSKKSEGIKGADDIMFYFTGDRFVKDLEKNYYLPGAVADHLTSSGGKLTNSGQMSAIEWLRAGATGSYGTVVEPCAILGKFPHPGRLMELYLAGHTLLEAYWKSVLMPGQGVFIGDPLASPFQGYRMALVGQHSPGEHIRVDTHQLQPGLYKLMAANLQSGPYNTVQNSLSIATGPQHFIIRPPYQTFYRLERLIPTGTWPLSTMPLSRD